jgi:hypothetical protein
MLHAPRVSLETTQTLYEPFTGAKDKKGLFPVIKLSCSLCILKGGNWHFWEFSLTSKNFQLGVSYHSVKF